MALNAKQIKKLTWDLGDYCLRTSHYVLADYLINNNKLRPETYKALREMEKECKPDSAFRSRKSYRYSWSISGSANPAENTFLQRPTYWIYKHILSRFNIDLPKPLNGDQLRAYILLRYTLSLNPLYRKESLKVLKNIFRGFILRLGFYPHFLAHIIIFKPQPLVLLFKALKDISWNPIVNFLYIYALVIFRLRFRAKIKTPAIVETTNKISSIPTAIHLDLYKQLTPEYIKKVYTHYYRPPHLRPLGKILAKAISKFFLLDKK